MRPKCIPLFTFLIFVPSHLTVQVLNFAYSTRPTLTWGSFAIRLPYLKVTGLSLSKPQKVFFGFQHWKTLFNVSSLFFWTQGVIISLTVGVGLVAFLSRYLRRRKRTRPAQPSRLDAATLNRRLRSGFRSPNGGINLVFSYNSDLLITCFIRIFSFRARADFLSEFQSTSPVPQRIHRTRSASVNSDRYSVSEGADAKSTPQLLGTMGKFETNSWITNISPSFLSTLGINVLVHG